MKALHPIECLVTPEVAGRVARVAEERIERVDGGPDTLRSVQAISGYDPFGIVAGSVLADGLDAELLVGEVARLRALTTQAIADLDGSHYVNEHGDWCAVCGAADGAWPCAARQVADDLRRAVGT